MKKSYKLSNKKLKYKIKNYTKINKLKGGSICNLFSKSPLTKPTNPLQFSIAKPSNPLRKISKQEQNVIDKEHNKRRVNAEALIKQLSKNDTQYRAKFVILNNKIIFTIPNNREQVRKTGGASIIDKRKSLYKTFSFENPKTESSKENNNKQLKLSLSELMKIENDKKYKTINYIHLNETNTANQDIEIYKIKQNTYTIYNFFNCIKDDKKVLPFITHTMPGSILRILSIIGDTKQLYTYEIIGLSYDETYKMCESILDIYNNFKSGFDKSEFDKSEFDISKYIKYSKILDTIVAKLNEAFSREVEYVYE